MSSIEQLSTPKVLDGLLAEDQLLKELNVSQRTARRREAEGMPYIRIGIKRYYDPTAVRVWLMGRQSNHASPRRGRPSKRIA